MAGAAAQRRHGALALSESAQLISAAALPLRIPYHVCVWCFTASQCKTPRVPYTDGTITHGHCSAYRFGHRWWQRCPAIGNGSSDVAGSR